METHTPHSTHAPARALLLALAVLAAAGSARPLAQADPAAAAPGVDASTTPSPSASAKSTSSPAKWAMLSVLVVAAVIFVAASAAYCLGFKNKRARGPREAVTTDRPRVRRRERNPADVSVVDLPLYTHEPAHDEVQLLRRHNTQSEAGHAAPEYLSPTADVPPYASRLGHGDDDEEEGGARSPSSPAPSTSSQATVRPVLRALATSEAALGRPAGPSSASAVSSRAAPYSPILSRGGSQSASVASHTGHSLARGTSQASHGGHSVSRGASTRSVRFESDSAGPSRQPSKASLKQRLGAWVESYVALGDDDDDDERIGGDRQVHDPWRPLSIRRVASPLSPASPSSTYSHSSYATAAASLSRRSTADSVTEARVATVARGRVARAVIVGEPGEVVFEAPEEEMLAEQHGERSEREQQSQPQQSEHEQPQPRPQQSDHHA